MRWIAVTMVLIATGCDPTANPRSCLDGVCSDPDFPFCDIDGTFGGAPKECIDAGCTVGMFERCVGADAYTCNEFGNNFDVETCAAGCDDAVGGCRVCSTNSDCEAATPVCDVAMNSCRQCTVDTECESEVCDRGTCLARTSILYAAADGTSDAACIPTERCTLSAAVAKSLAPGAPQIVHLASGTYIGLRVPSAAVQLTLVGHEATLAGVEGGLVVDAGANVRVRNLTITGTNDVLLCGQATGARASVAIANSTLVQPEPYRIIGAENCDLTISATELRGASGGSIGGSVAIFLASDVSMIADRIHVSGLRSTMLGGMGQRIAVRVTNSVLENFGFINLTTDTLPPGSSFTFAWNTLVGRNSDAVLDCNATSTRQIRYENNIVYSTAVEDVVFGTGCSTQHNILSPQSPIPLNNFGSDPQFQSVAVGDFRPKSTSPALNAANAVLTPTDHDFAGAVRPQGPGFDIGAFEQ